MMDDLVKRATYALEDMQGRVDAGKLAMFADCIDRIEELEAKLAEVEASSQGWIDAAVEQQVRRKRAEARLLEVEAERDAFASNIPDAAQNLIRNAQTGRLKALHRAKALVEAGKAVIDRWDSPLWRDLRHMGESIDELRATISALENNK